MKVGESESESSNGTVLPSRRAIVQDAMEMYISELYPEVHRDYVSMLEDCGMYQRTEAHEEWRANRALNR